ncbi:MAG: DNA modification methylase, partial [Chloroflexi bacterium]|nr:DNA modification methylase [Chloroflexota bacterium]
MAQGAIRDRVKELRRVRAGDLIPNPKNWRRHPERQRAALEGVLADIGYADVLLARETPDGLMLIDGHLRAETTPDIEVPVIILDVDEAEADKLLATLDPLAGLAEQDDGMLADLLRTLETPSEALQGLLDELGKSTGLMEPEALTDPDAVPDVPEEPTAKLGDLYVLGDHRLLCGDATKAEDVERLMEGAKADLVFTDPPYGVNVTGAGGKPIAGDISFTAIPLMFDMLDGVMGDGAWCYVCGGQSNLLLYAKMFERYFRQLPRLIVWDKGRTAVMRQNGYHSCYEFIYYAFKAGGGGRWFAGRKSENADDIWRIPVDDDFARVHVTQKPAALPARAIEN